jgi:hypothetical protein
MLLAVNVVSGVLKETVGIEICPFATPFWADSAKPPWRLVHCHTAALARLCQVAVQELFGGRGAAWLFDNDKSQVYFTILLIGMKGESQVLILELAPGVPYGMMVLWQLRFISGQPVRKY